MEGSSYTRSMGSNINGGVLIFKNKTCRCGKKAGLKISESFDNPGKLFFFGEKRPCKIFSWWEPNATELLGSIQGGGDLNRDGIDEKFKLLNAKMQTLESSVIGIMHNQMTMVNGSLNGLKKMMLLTMLLLACFIFFYVSSMNMYCSCGM
ncbi:hypothetical protein Ddye_001167 [Dipteronia dyeriana]|uniref:Uncharacterized protein n=1 Tax=Dipteronia dyeriana TaxID=168575 RepID=A0AAE0CTR4_9ROSI|nr:hypothetical protein Ddye_001167 [Dipteronia dyeriana]